MFPCIMHCKTPIKAVDRWTCLGSKSDNSAINDPYPTNSLPIASCCTISLFSPPPFYSIPLLSTYILFQLTQVRYHPISGVTPAAANFDLCPAVIAGRECCARAHTCTHVHIFACYMYTHRHIHIHTLYAHICTCLILLTQKNRSLQKTKNAYTRN